MANRQVDQRVSKNATADSIESRTSSKLPIVNVSPLVSLPPIAGSMVFNPSNSLPYFGNGTQWISLSSGTSAAPGTYGSTSQTPQITVDAQGNITNVTNVAITAPQPLGAQAYLSVNQGPIPASTDTTVLFNATENANLATQAKFTYATGVFTCTEAGLYLTNASCLWDNGSLGNFQVRVDINAIPAVLSTQLDRTTGGVHSMNLSGVIRLIVGDQIRVVVRQTAVGAFLRSGETGLPTQRATQVSFVRVA